MSPSFVHQATFNLPGPIYGFKGGLETWRHACEEQLRGELQAKGLYHLTLSTKIVARFYQPKGGRKCDLDNMIKVLVDSMGAAGLFAPSTGGGKKGPRNTDDHWIDRIEAEKVEVKEGARVEVEVWTRTSPSSS